MQDLKISLIQADIAWENKSLNLKHFEELLSRVETGTDLVALPEMFSTGFTMSPANLAERMDGPSVSWMLNQAKNRKFVLAGSIIIEDNGAYFNRFIWANPDGSLVWYNKRHLFSMAGEEKIYYPGNQKLIVELKGWKVCPMVCYDLRFPEWVRNQEGYDFLLFVASWPERRIHHWQKLLQARAIENQCFAAGVNRLGKDGNGILHNGSSLIIDPQGNIIADAGETEGIISATLSKEEIIKTRRYMPFLSDMDDYSIRLV